MDRNLRLRDLEKILVRHGLVLRAGKGSEILIQDPLRTRKRHVIGRHGRNPEIARQVIASVRRKFCLTPEHGVSDEDFYAPD